MTCFLIAVQNVSAGLISLVASTNPLMIIILSSVILKRKLLVYELVGVIISISGLLIASYPNLKESHATIKGLLALILGIASLSVGSIYFTNAKLQSGRMMVNTWQITFGSLFFIPVILFNRENNFIRPDLNFFLSFIWLVLPVSIIAYTLWLNLLHKDSVKAGIWLFLSPVFGFNGNHNS